MDAQRRSSPGAALRVGGQASSEERLIREREPLPTRLDDLPDLPSAYADALEPALAALAGEHEGGLGDAAAGAAASAAIAGHVRLLLAWNDAINLTSIIEPGAVARLHVTDSLAALPLVRGGAHATIVDLGSGGGFPGLELAAALPTSVVTLVDSVGKKAAFLEVAARVTGLRERLIVANRRAETLPRDHWDVVTARAVGALADLVEMALPLLRPGGRLIAWKRGALQDELAAAARAAAALGGSRPAFHPIAPSVAAVAGLDGHGFAVVRKMARTPPGYPRDPATRRRAPW